MILMLFTKVRYLEVESRYMPLNSDMYEPVEFDFQSFVWKQILSPSLPVLNSMYSSRYLKAHDTCLTLCCMGVLSLLLFLRLKRERRDILFCAHGNADALSVFLSLSYLRCQELIVATSHAELLFEAGELVFTSSEDTEKCWEDWFFSQFGLLGPKDQMVLLIKYVAIRVCTAILKLQLDSEVPDLELDSWNADVFDYLQSSPIWQQSLEASLFGVASSKAEEKIRSSSKAVNKNNTMWDLNHVDTEITKHHSPDPPPFWLTIQWRKIAKLNVDLFSSNESETFNCEWETSLRLSLLLVVYGDCVRHALEE
jgi:hypothetical protein